MFIFNLVMQGEKKNKNQVLESIGYFESAFSIFFS